VADEKNTEQNEETPVEENEQAEAKPKRTRKKAEPGAAAPEDAEKPKRMRKEAEPAPVEPEETPVVAEPTPEEPVAEAPAEEPAAPEGQTPEGSVPEETVEEPAAFEESVPEAPEAVAEPAPEVEVEEAAVPTRGPKPKKKRLPRAERHKHAKPKREKPAQRKPITRLPKPEAERGRDQQRRGVVVSAAMDKTIVVRVDSVKAHPKYKKVIRRSKKFHAHDEQNQAKAGDVVRIVETRPLSKTKRWRLAEILEVAK
jgi:small subunit ribosomal protein S17